MGCIPVYDGITLHSSLTLLYLTLIQLASKSFPKSPPVYEEVIAQEIFFRSL